MTAGRARLLAFVGIAAVQVLLPLRGLLDPEPPVMFGWQMYARRVDRPTIVITDGSGRQRRVGYRRFGSVWRAEIDYEGRLPRYVCSVSPQARAVTVTRKRPRRTATVRCK